jgi:hypothetical protein
MVPREDSGNPADVREHGAKEVADPQVPITLWDVCPLAAPIVSTGVIVGDEPKEHVNQVAPNVPQLTLVTVPAPPEFPLVHVPGLPGAVQYQLFRPGVASVWKYDSPAPLH